MAIRLFPFLSLFSLTTVSAAPAMAQNLLYQDVKAIIDQNCVHCHNPSGLASFLPLTKFEEIKGNHTYMHDAVNTDYMPMDKPGFGVTEDGKKLLAWLKSGADLYPPTEPPPPPHILMRDPRELTYADLKPVIDRSCVGCHNPQGEMRKKPFTNLNEIKRYASLMWKRLDQGRMPRGNAEFRFSQDGRALMGWLRYGRDVVGDLGGGGRDDDGAGDDDAAP